FVLSSRSRLADREMDADYRLRPKLAGRGVRLRMHRIELHLDDPTPVAKVDEYQAAEIATAVYPAIDVDGLSRLLDTQRATRGSGRQAHPALRVCVTVGTTSRPEWD